VPLRDSLETGVAPPVDLEATHSSALEFVNLEELQAHALAMTKRRGYSRFQSRTAKSPDSETRGARPCYLQKQRGAGANQPNRPEI
jgi:uncharacterized protein DUF2237